MRSFKTMVTLNGSITDDGRVLLSEDSFEHLLNCLDNQKFIDDINADALTGDYVETQRETQDVIDGFVCQCESLFRKGALQRLAIDNEPIRGLSEVLEYSIINSDIVLSLRTFGYLLDCINSQKAICKRQRGIDSFNRKCRAILKG